MATPKKSTKAAKSEKTAAEQSADKPAHLAPVVNLTNAAQSAAMLFAHRAKRGSAGGSSAESGSVNAATFKKLKDGIGQPQHAATSPLAGLNKPVKPTGSPGFMKQGGHGQTGGANVARTGVPRRTSGG